ncbi:MAG: cytochrome c peroxidase [Bacteroidota bacterium]
MIFTRNEAKFILNPFCWFLILVISCSAEEEEIDDYVVSEQFSEGDMSILEDVLNLKEKPFNYANLELPPHYQSDDAYESDNTPEENRITNMGATLGRVLFYDLNLSANNTISCASCHKQSEGFSDNRKFSVGLNGETTKRNSMTLINSRYYENGRFMWDESAATLEEQVLLPIQHHQEMGMDLSVLEGKLQQLDYYNVLFEKAFGSPQVTTDRISMALAQFVRSIISHNSKFDKGLELIGPVEDEEEMPNLPNFSDLENLGIDIFYRGRKGGTCLYCHGSAQSINDEAKNNGLSLNYKDKGKGAFTGRDSDNALFKVPSLRNVALTAPYMHDGRFKTLMDVVNHYSDSVQSHANLNFRLTTLDDGESGEEEVLHLRLTQREKEALVAYLETLTDEKITKDEKYSNPFKQ